MDGTKLPKTAISIALVVILSVVVLLGGCSGTDKPRMRFGAFFGSPLGMEFTNPARLGTHHFEFSLSETNGMVYTSKGGFIDIAHVREAADRTVYLRNVAYRNLVGRKTEFSFRVIEPSKYRVKLSYPEGWDDLSEEERETIANEVSIRLGQYLAHTSLIWHEIVTWYGFASSGIFSDRISSFSWEDTYSDVVGTWLGAEALRHRQRPYDEVMTRLLYHKLKELDVQSPRGAREAAKRIEGQWYTGGLYFFVDMKRRNCDVGLDNNRITPWLVPGICPDAVPQSCPVPDLALLCEYGFNIEVELDPQVLEKGKIYHAIGLAGDGRMRPQMDFPRIMAQIEDRESRRVVSAAGG